MDDKRLYVDLGKMVAARRAELDRSQAEIANRIGISRASLANIEVGRQRLLVHQLYRLTEALELDGPQQLLPAPSKTPDTLPIAKGDLTPKQRSQIERLVQAASTTKKQ